MSATGASSSARTHVRPSGNLTLGPVGAGYLVAVVGVAAILIAPLHLSSATHTDWLLFAVLTACAVPVQLLSVETPANHAYSPALVFFVAGALLLPPQLVALMVVLAHVPDWARGRYPWYIQIFNVARWTCAAVAASLISGVLIERSDPGQDVTRLVLGGVLAAAACVLVDDVLLAQMLRFARGTTYRESGLFGFANLSTELVLAALGVGLAAGWELAPVLVPFLLAPLVVVYRALRLPGLELAARLDPKTDLFNARYFTTAVEAEIERARRFGRPLSILLADLDLLRDVNNTHGHLAGDAVLRGVAGVLRAQLRPFDIPCRFGGEEFAVVLPEAGHDDALVIAERVRQAVASTPFRIPNGEKEIHATVSLGVATHPECASADELVHQADLALYRSKALGRNRVTGRVELNAPEPDQAEAPEPRTGEAGDGEGGWLQGRIEVIGLGVLVAAISVTAAVVLARGPVLEIVHAGTAARDRVWPLVLAAIVLPLAVGLGMLRTLARTRASVEEGRRQNAELERRRQRARRTYLGTIEALSRTIEGSDAAPGPDWARQLSVSLARALGYRREDLEAIEIGALLRDIGKTRVSKQIVNKPGPLTDLEWLEMKSHALSSHQLLADLDVHPFVRQIARSSHERIDGEGYPDRLAGEEIPLPARIVLVAEAFDALARGRPYRSARGIVETLEELRANAGTQFCPTVLAALECLWRERADTFQDARERPKEPPAG